MIDDDVLRKARIKALDEGTSVNAVARESLERYVGKSEQAAVRRAIVESALKFTSGGSGPGGRSWTRDELYDR